MTINIKTNQKDNESLRSRLCSLYKQKYGDTLLKYY